MLIPALLALAAVTAPVMPFAQVVVEERRLPSDEMIQTLVVQRLAANGHLEGKIGVESHDAVVTLTGWTRTAGQAWIAENETRMVAGVAGVHNQIRPRMSA
jgi:osmotically-inducible protein OsmY